jgi:FkbM family methyltransferase
MIKKLIKILLTKKILYKIIFFKNLIINFDYNFTTYILSRKISIKDKNNNTLFTVRNWGGSTKSRAKKIYFKEPETIKYIDNFVKNSTFFDIGANIGIFTMYAAAKKIKTIAFEPDPLNFATLNQNIFDSHLGNYSLCYPLAIDKKKKISKFFFSNFKFGSSANSFERNIDEHGKKFRNIFECGAVSISIDEFCNETKIIPNYLKIDVDGNELRVISGMKNLLKNKNLKMILIELNLSFKEHKMAQAIIIANKFKLEGKYSSYKNPVNYNYVYYKK